MDHTKNHVTALWNPAQGMAKRGVLFIDLLRERISEDPIDPMPPWGRGRRLSLYFEILNKTSQEALEVITYVRLRSSARRY